MRISFISKQVFLIWIQSFIFQHLFQLAPLFFIPVLNQSTPFITVNYLFIYGFLFIIIKFCLNYPLKFYEDLISLFPFSFSLTHSHTHTHTHTHTYIYTNTHIHKHTNIYTKTHTRIHKQTHTYTNKGTQKKHTQTFQSVKLNNLNVKYYPKLPSTLVKGLSKEMLNVIIVLFVHISVAINNNVKELLTNSVTY